MKNRIVITVLAALATVLFAGSAVAQGNPPERQPSQAADRRAVRPRPPVDTALDANGDEVISASEIATAAAALLKLDRNGDGRLVAEEYLPPRPDGAREDAPVRGTAATPPEDARRRGAGPKPPIVAALDANADGVLDRDEIVRSTAAVAKLDRNGDGSLSPDEYRPPRPDGDDRPRRGRAAGGEPSVPASRPSAPPSAVASASAPVISGVVLAFDPLRLVVSGHGFRKNATILISGQAAPASTLKTSDVIVATGSSLETALPKGTPVAIVVVNPGGAQSPPWRFTR